jgi:phosphate transport system substrate-binding protein
MRDILNAWQQAFHRHHPKITFEPTLYGSGTGMAGIITGTSDLALMGRPVTPNEVIGFEWVFRYKPLQIQVLTGSLAQPDHSPALAVFVSTQNPLRGLSMQQLATLLGCPGQKSTPTTWAAAGVEGPWSARPVHAFLPDEESGTGAFLQQTLLGAGPEAPDRWNWNVVHEFRDTPEATASEQILQALRQDPNALAVATLAHPVSGTRVLPINGIAPTRDTLIAASYPLTRGVYIDINRKPGTPIAPRLAEFLRFILSPEGQRIAATEGGFLPLNPVRAAEQANLLQ